MMIRIAMAALACFGIYRKIIAGIPMRIVAGDTGERLTFQKTFTFGKKPVLISMNVISFFRRYPRTKWCKIIGKCISYFETERRNVFLPVITVMAHRTRIRLLLA